MAACPVCGGEVREGKTFCSRGCANTFHGRLRQKSVLIKCAICGKEFSVKPSDHRFKEGTPPKYCGRECFFAAARSSEIKPCAFCGKPFYTTRQRFCSRSCFCEYRKAHNTPGRWAENGYVVRYTGNGEGKKEHIAIMEAHVGRAIKPTEIVHHINGDRSDNRLENLQLMTRGEHSRLHREIEKSEGRRFFQRIDQHEVKA